MTTITEVERILPTEGACKSLGLWKISFSATIFLSSILLFLIQPIIARQLLPLFGGAAAVWATCLVFFQCVLLAGYLYAHLLIRCVRPGIGIAVHIVLLFAAVIVIFLPHAFSPIDEVTNPAYECLRMLARNVGLPYFVLSSTTPLIQSWYTRGTSVGLPYRLYALSNFGSLLALIAYPFGVERFFDIALQLASWQRAYLVFAFLCGSVAISSLRCGADESIESLHDRPQNLSMHQALTWIALAACSSALLLAVTNVLCQNIAPMPLLWVAPLALYLVTFILCFDQAGWFTPALYRLMVPAALIGITWAGNAANQNLWIAVGVCLAGMFTVCMFCHGQLALLKPISDHSTAFYLCVSVGGALGGVFVGLLAPALFSDFIELDIAIALGLVLSLRFLFAYRSPVFLACCGVAALLSLRLVGAMDEGAVTFRGRNFYGAISTRDNSDGSAGRIRTLVHGRTIHGGQILDEQRKLEPTFYYGRESGIGIALSRPIRHRRIGVVGLGTGTLAAYGEPGDYYRFYEINPMVAELARSKFTFLRDSKSRSDVVLGDGRLSLEREPEQQFDTLVLDAFSGDSIPVHLLTYEAFECYFRHLKAAGVIAVHVSNQYLDFRPVVADLAARFNRSAFLVQSAPRPDRHVLLAEWILLTNDREFIGQLGRIASAEIVPPPGHRLWTDQFSNVLDILR